MAENKKAFLMYADWIDSVEDLSDEEAGILLKHLLRYVNDRNPTCENRIVNIAFNPLKQQLKRDLKRWEEFRERQSVNGKKGGRPPKENPEEPKKPKPFLENPNKATQSQKSLNVTVNVNDSVNVNETINTCALLLWVQENCKRVQKLKEPITNEQAEQLEKDFGIENCQSLFLDMENYKKLNETYTSANLTFRKWIAREKKTGIADRFGHKQISNNHVEIKKL